MAAKILGYVLALLGVIAVVFSTPSVPQSLKLPLPAALSSTPLLVAGIILVLAGIFIILKSSRSSKQAPEVPIYEGEKVVGYRRMKK